MIMCNGFFAVQFQKIYSDKWVRLSSCVIFAFVRSAFICRNAHRYMQAVLA